MVNEPKSKPVLSKNVLVGTRGEVITVFPHKSGKKLSLSARKKKQKSFRKVVLHGSAIV